MSKDTTELILNKISSLETGWNGYGALPITEAAIKSAREIIPRLVKLGLSQPAIVPTVRGGIQIEWHENGVDLEIDISDIGEIMIFRD
jgi:hypothetical protein